MVMNPWGIKYKNIGKKPSNNLIIFIDYNVTVYVLAVFQKYNDCFLIFLLSYITWVWFKWVLFISVLFQRMFLPWVPILSHYDNNLTVRCFLQYILWFLYLFFQALFLHVPIHLQLFIILNLNYFTMGIYY